MAIQREYTGKLDIDGKFTSIMSAATGESSIYLHAKNTVKALVADSSMTEREKAEIISKTIATIATSVTNSAMEIAYKMAVNDREAPFTLTKLRVDTELADAHRVNLTKEERLIDSKIAQVESSANYQTMQGWILQGQLYRDYGVDVSDLKLSNTIMRKNGSEFSELSTKGMAIKAGEVDIYTKMASSINQNSKVDYTFKKVSSSQEPGHLDSATLGTAGMAYQQTRVAERNVTAFDDNMRQHAANSSASMLGVMIGSTAFTDSSSYKTQLDLWKSAMGYLNGSLVPAKP